MKTALEIGHLAGSRKAFTLPLDYATRTGAIVAMRGAGKTVTATVIAEEMCEAGLPWIAFDPVGVWWGLRVNPDGSAGGYPVLIVGGEHGDLPLEKHAAPRLAEALVRENVCCVIDLALESKNTWRGFVADFCDRLMELRPSVPRHIFLEEAPEFIPQKPMGEQKRSLAAVDRLTRLGRNNGYGTTVVSQRFATVQKDVLTQCENLFAMRTTGKPDRTAAKDWIGECVQPAPDDPTVQQFLDSLADLNDGEGWFWSPQWLKLFEQVKVRERKTYHPGRTRSVGQAAQQVELSNVRDFVERVRPLLEEERPKPAGKTVAKAAPAPAFKALQEQSTESTAKLRAAEAEAARLRGQNADLHRQLGAAKATVQALRQTLEPQYRAMERLFADLDTVASTNGAGDRAVWELWKAKLGSTCSRIIDVLCDRGGTATTAQLATLTGVAPRTLLNNLAPLSRNGLITRSHGSVTLRVP